MVLTAEKIYFFSDKNKVEVIGCINLKLIKVEVKQDKDKLVLDFKGESENIVLKYDSSKDRD